MDQEIQEDLLGLGYLVDLIQWVLVDQEVQEVQVDLGVLGDQQGLVDHLDQGDIQVLDLLEV